MKKLLYVLITLGSLNVFAAPLEAVNCKRELMAAGLAARVSETTLEFLLVSDFSIVDFTYAPKDFPQYDFIVETEAKRRDDGSTYVVDYGVKLLDLKTCKVSAQIIAD